MSLVEQARKIRGDVNAALSLLLLVAPPETTAAAADLAESVMADTREAEPSNARVTFMKLARRDLGIR